MHVIKPKLQSNKFFFFQYRHANTFLVVAFISCFSLYGFKLPFDTMSSRIVNILLHTHTHTHLNILTQDLIPHDIIFCKESLTLLLHLFWELVIRFLEVHIYLYNYLPVCINIISITEEMMSLGRSRLNWRSVETTWVLNSFHITLIHSSSVFSVSLRWHVSINWTGSGYGPLCLCYWRGKYLMYLE